MMHMFSTNIWTWNVNSLLTSVEWTALQLLFFDFHKFVASSELATVLK